MLDHHKLAPEIWIEILRWATTSGKEVALIASSYVPFQPAPHDALDPVIDVKTKVALVCRKWKYLASAFLYENIRLSSGIHALRDALDQDGGYGRLVRRVVLPYRSTAQSLPSIEVLRHCANLETLVRPRWVVPEPSQFHFEAEELPFPSLQRLDWWYNSDAERSGGINSLKVVLHGAPNLRYLAVGCVVGHGHILTGVVPLTLSHLHTLRLHGSNSYFLRKLADLMYLPALTNIIVDFPLVQMGLSHVWETFGSQLQTVEFGKHVRFLLDDHLTVCLHGCPNLIHLNFFLFFTMIPSPAKLHPTSIATIGLHAAQCCEHIEKHFDLLMSDVFPALRRIILHGEWRGIISHPRLAGMWCSLRDRGIVATSPDC
ncbi:hypothetical protein FPV67DRAFT_1558172 [Lyophyllum atratum]|nr:hypothetical protein FPV67DRAFT_1558172 [Lyophyllum atratum]